MTLTIEYDKKDRIVKVKAPGTMDADNIKNMVADFNRKAFVDHSNANITVTAIEMLSIPGGLKKVGLNKKQMIAVYLPDNSTEK